MRSAALSRPLGQSKGLPCSSPCDVGPRGFALTGATDADGEEQGSKPTDMVSLGGRLQCGRSQLSRVELVCLDEAPLEDAPARRSRQA